jgi:hypothetical protein
MKNVTSFPDIRFLEDHINIIFKLSDDYIIAASDMGILYFISTKSNKIVKFITIEP